MDSLPSPSLRFPSLSTLPFSYLTLLLPFPVPSVVPHIPLSFLTFLIHSQPSPFPPNLPRPYVCSSLPFSFPTYLLSYLSSFLPISFPTYLLPFLPPPFSLFLPLPFPLSFPSPPLGAMIDGGGGKTFLHPWIWGNAFSDIITGPF